MFLHTFQDRFCISSENFSEALSFDRRSSTIARIASSSLNSTPAAYNQQIDGIIGVIQLVKDKYLIVISESKQCAAIAGAEIRQIVDADIIPFNMDTHCTPQQELDEVRFLELLRRQLRCGSLYFSPFYDLSLSTAAIAQIRVNTQLRHASVPQWKRADPRFFWNRYLSQPLIENNCDEWVLPILNGYVFSQSFSMTSIQQSASYGIDFVIISRRSVERSGRRFTTRGLDMKGHAANFAESEQIIFVHDPSSGMNSSSASSLSSSSDSSVMHVFSFLQTRGSIPILWQQQPTLKYTPKIQILKEGKETETAFRRHFETQLQLYGRQYAVNLVNQKGSEGMLAKAYTNMVKMFNHKDIKLTSFDFHHECKAMKYENIYKLIYIIGREELDKNMAYFHAKITKKGDWEIISTQKAVFRTNCVDCLDRTNVVQSVFARVFLEKQLRELGIWKKENIGKATLGGGSFKDEAIVFPNPLEAIVKTAWANNADAMSLQYSGTGALKTDYTRTGKRTWRGNVQDGVNSVTRYYLNNFQDGLNQDAVDLFLGYYRPLPASSLSATTYLSPFDDSLEQNHHSKQDSLLWFLTRFALIFTLLWYLYHSYAPAWMAPLTSFSNEFQIIAFVVVLLIIAAQVSLKFGRSFTNKPRLRVHHLISG